MLEHRESAADEARALRSAHTAESASPSDVDERAAGERPATRAAVAVAATRARIRPARRRSIESDAVRLEALASLYDEHAAAVHACARWMCGSAHADDITRLVFVDAWRRSGRLDRRDGSIRTQLAVAVYRHAEDRSRRAGIPGRRGTRRPSASLPPTDSESGPESATVDAADDVFESGLLSPSERYALALILIGHCTYAEVARLLNESDHAIVANLTATLHRLRSPLLLLVRQGDEEVRP